MVCNEKHFTRFLHTHFTLILKIHFGTFTIIKYNISFIYFIKTMFSIVPKE